MISILADAGCTLFNNPSSTPSLPTDTHEFRRHLNHLFTSSSSSSNPSILSDFLTGFSSHIRNPNNLRRILVSAPRGSLLRNLLLVPSLQLQLQLTLLEKLPEYYFDVEISNPNGSLEDDFARLILNHFRWLDFLVDPKAFCDKLMEEIVGSLPEIIGDQNNDSVISSLQHMLEEDSEIIVPVLDSFSNLNLEGQLHEQAIMIALSCIRTVDGENMPYLIRFLMLSATSVNAGRIISQIRQHLKFIGGTDSRSARGKKLKGKLQVDNYEALVLEALRSSLRFKNSVEKIIKKKIIEGCFRECLFDQCIQGQGDSKGTILEYFSSFLSVCESLLACKEHRPREFGMQLYASISNYSYEVSAALETMVLIASKYSQELIPISSYINGILDYLEGFSIDNLHKVYEVFSHLALSSRCNADSIGSSIANELLMIIRKQIVSCLGNRKNAAWPSFSQRTNCQESLELLKMSLDSCKFLPRPLTLFYDELIALLESTSLQPAITEWIGKHVGEFEAIYLSDLEGGKLLSENSFFDLEGNLWMNLDGDLSPICLSVLPLLPDNLFCFEICRTLLLLAECFLESLLNTSLKLYPVSLPELHLLPEHHGSSYFSKPSFLGNKDSKSDNKRTSESTQTTSSGKRKKLKNTATSDNSQTLRQPTIMDVLRKAGVTISQEGPKSRSSGPLYKGTESQSEEIFNNDPNGPVDISDVIMVLDSQRSKCWPLRVDCLSILSFPEIQDSCSDPAVELPLYLYLLRDLHNKLDDASPPSKQFPPGSLRAPPALNRMTTSELLNKIKLLFPSLRKHFDCAVFVLKEEGDETYQESWNTQSASAGNPDIPDLVISKPAVAGSVFSEVLFCVSKMLKLPDIQMDMQLLLDLLEAFQPIGVPEIVLSISPLPSAGSIDYMYCGAYSFLEGVMDIACSFTLPQASEVIATLESVVSSAKSFVGQLLERDNKNMIQKILHIYLEYSDSTADLLEEHACSILPQVHSGKTKSEEAVYSFPTLCSTTFIVWYRVPYEQNLTVLNKLVKEAAVVAKCASDVRVEAVTWFLVKLRQSVNVLVSLVNMCRIHEKVNVHAMAVKYGGKFVDLFLKVFNFLEANFQVQADIIIQLVKELQKATRTIQTLCSEAKGLRQTMITTKIPATKWSMERFLFRVKALFLNTSSGCTFWMGNLKHEDLFGQVVSSQVYADKDDANIDKEAEATMEATNDDDDQATKSNSR
ncbi:hypothetical protein MKX01_020159 [Papaver californicum]|nr:hypothetical protein MKX01_020159 [Papaver californicum]